jgi:hypothetical protein
MNFTLFPEALYCFFLVCVNINWLGSSQEWCLKIGHDCLFPRFLTTSVPFYTAVEKMFLKYPTPNISSDL